MAAIRSKDTGPEMKLRRALHAIGLRYSLHRRDLPGTPDLVLRKYRAVVFVHGCFWHGHDCPLFQLPATRRDFWAAKIERNRQNDRRAAAALSASGWRVANVWECAMRGPGSLSVDALTRSLARWLRGKAPAVDIRGPAGATP